MFHTNCRGACRIDWRDGGPWRLMGLMLAVMAVAALLLAAITAAQVSSVTQPIITSPSALSTMGITPVVSTAAENSHVLKASAGNLYNAYATNFTSTAGWLVVLNSTTVPADGAITPFDCAYLPPNGSASINYGAGPPAVYSTGITAVVTSATTCFTKTTGTITAFFKGGIQ